MDFSSYSSIPLILIGLGRGGGGWSSARSPARFEGGFAPSRGFAHLGGAFWKFVPLPAPPISSLGFWVNPWGRRSCSVLVFHHPRDNKTPATCCSTPLGKPCESHFISNFRRALAAPQGLGRFQSLGALRNPIPTSNPKHNGLGIFQALGHLGITGTAETQIFGIFLHPPPGFSRRFTWKAAVPGELPGELASHNRTWKQRRRFGSGSMVQNHGIL